MKGRLYIEILLLIVLISYTLLIEKKDKLENSSKMKLLVQLKDQVYQNKLKVGTCGDYKPVTFYNKSTGKYEGLEIELIEKFAQEKGYKIEFIKTTWPTLLNDTLEGNFDLAIGGITITKNRKDKALMSTGYLKAGKTFLMRKEDINKYKTISDVNKTNVNVMVNPGGTNEKFARANLSEANITIHNINEEIPSKISKKEADIMVTEVMEGLVYTKEINNLAVPLYKNPFTDSDIGILMNKDNNTLLNDINDWILIKIKDHTIENLKKKYIPFYEKSKIIHFSYLYIFIFINILF